MASIGVAVRRTANPAQVAWEASGVGERGYLRLYLNLANTVVCEIGQSGFAVARSGIHTISPNAAVDFSGEVHDEGTINPNLIVTVSGTLLVGQTMAEAENHSQE
jgi:hypothetical protein